MIAHVSEKKKEELRLIKNLLEQYPVVGIVDMTDLPSVQLQRLRAKLKESLLLRLTKKRLIRFALEQLKEKRKDIEKLEGALTNCMPALIFTKESPFKLSRILNQNKSNAVAKAGQIASKDIVIPAGPTKFTPGPVIGELGQLGIKTTVESGKITIKEDILLVKGGEVISKRVADILLKLGIEPMEIGLNLVSLYEDGVVYGKDVLSIDESKYIEDIKKATNEAFNLALNCGYVIGETVPFLIKKAYLNARFLAKKINFATSEDIKEEILKAEIEAINLGNNIPAYEKKVEESKVEEKSKKKAQKEGGQEVKEAKEIIQQMVDRKIRDEEKKKEEEEKRVPTAFELAEKKKKEGKR